jgi:hypothetical protein
MINNAKTIRAFDPCFRVPTFGLSFRGLIFDLFQSPVSEMCHVNPGNGTDGQYQKIFFYTRFVMNQLPFLAPDNLVSVI